MALVNPPTPSTVPHGNSTMTSATPPLSISLLAVTIPIGLALGNLAFPYVEGWLDAWLVRRLKLRMERNQEQQIRLEKMPAVEALIKGVSNISTVKSNTLVLTSPKNNKGDTNSDASSEEQFKRARILHVASILAKMKKEFAEIFKASVEMARANLSEHEKKLAIKEKIKNIEWELAYSMFGKVEEMEFFVDDNTDSDAIVSDSDKSSGDTISDSGKTSNDTQLVLASPSINVAADTSGAGISESASPIITNSNPATDEGNLDIAPMSKRDRTGSTATDYGSDDETETKEDE